MTPLALLARRFRVAQDGVAGLEMTLVCSVFTVAMMNAVEVASYAMAAQQVAMATQAGAAAALASCDTVHLPATRNCENLESAVQAGVASTSLGSAVSLREDPTEGYYCLTPAGALQYVADVDSRPADCSAVDSPTTRPALYLRVRTRYVHAPTLGLWTVADTFQNPIQRETWMRMQ